MCSSDLKEAVKTHGVTSLKTLVDNLPAVSYGELRMVLASTKVNAEK